MTLAVLVFLGVLGVWMLSRRRGGAPPADEPEELTIRIGTSLRGFRDNEDSGHRFIAPLEPDTPLSALKRDGEWSAGTDRPADVPGGYWQYQWDGREQERWNRYGIPAEDLDAFREFLIAFRQIVEGSVDTEAAIEAAEALCQQTPEFAEAIDARFPASWFAGQLAKVDGIGPGTAWNLFLAGFIDLDRLRSAPDEELLAVPGVGPGRVTQIRGYFSPRRRGPSFSPSRTPPDALPYHRSRRVARDVAEMLGLAKGVLADGVVTEAETLMLREWVAAHPDVTGEWVGRALVARLDRIFTEGEVGEEERRELQELLESLVGEGGGVLLGSSTATTLPLSQPPPDLVFPGRSFAFTGRFAFGPRSACEAEVRRLGGEVHPAILRSTDYLVIGTFGSPDWVQSSYGTKIRQALSYQEKRGLPFIITEDHWAAFLP